MNETEGVVHVSNHPHNSGSNKKAMYMTFAAFLLFVLLVGYLVISGVNNRSQTNGAVSVTPTMAVSEEVVAEPTMPEEMIEETQLTESPMPTGTLSVTASVTGAATKTPSPTKAPTPTAMGLQANPTNTVTPTPRPLQLSD